MIRSASSAPTQKQKRDPSQNDAIILPREASKLQGLSHPPSAAVIAVFEDLACVRQNRKFWSSVNYQETFAHTRILFGHVTGGALCSFLFFIRGYYVISPKKNVHFYLRKPLYANTEAKQMLISWA